MVIWCDILRKPRPTLENVARESRSRHPRSSFGPLRIRLPHAELQSEDKGENSSGTDADRTWLRYALASLDSVVVYGWPPLAVRICNLVSLKSLPATVLAAGVGADTGDEASDMAFPSRNAFSRAAFSARSRLSASICALIAAFARTSSIFSGREV
jgi:hypothetical protein